MSLTLIGCGIFQEETESILAGVDPPPVFIWQPVSLHDNLETMEATLDQALAEARAGGGWQADDYRQNFGRYDRVPAPVWRQPHCRREGNPIVFFCC